MSTKINVITPVKDSPELTLETIRAVCGSKFSIPHSYTVYNDFSTPENTAMLEKAAAEYGFELVNLSDVTDHPSPNYLLVLQMAQRRALEEDAALCIVESDVVVRPDTLQTLFDKAAERPDCGAAAAVTVDGNGDINFPYLYAKGKENGEFQTNKRLSFCCTLLTGTLLDRYPFSELDPSRPWHDVAISHQSLKLGMRNYLFTNLPVEHRPHGSRPWKHLKKSNPLKYYWRKFFTKKIN